jgi:hypothetical protein
VAEIPVDSQQDWIDADEKTRAMRRELKAAAFRMGIAALAHRVGLDETTLRNQINWQPRSDGKGCWKPSADVEFEIFWGDRQYRERKLGQCKERIAPVEDLEPWDFVREVTAKAFAGAFHPADRDWLLDLYQRVKKGGPR